MAKEKLVKLLNEALELEHQAMIQYLSHAETVDGLNSEPIIARLKELGVQKVAPSHCTGDSAQQAFRNSWGKDYVESGLGTIIEIPAGSQVRPGA